MFIISPISTFKKFKKSICLSLKIESFMIALYFIVPILSLFSLKISFSVSICVCPYRKCLKSMFVLPMNICDDALKICILIIFVIISIILLSLISTIHCFLSFVSNEMYSFFTIKSLLSSSVIFNDLSVRFNCCCIIYKGSEKGSCGLS